MTWLWVIALGLAAFFLLAFVLKAPRKGWEPIAAALLLGLAGFSYQAHPSQPGSPKEPEQRADKSGAALVEARKALASETAMPNQPNQWMVIADALSRNGQYGDAAGVVLGAVESDPRNANAWLSLANNLVAHADGSLTPAALYAYRRAAQADPQHPGPPFFMGLALAGSGKLAEGRALWADLLARTPADAPYRADLAERLQRLDAFIAAQAQPEQR
ncbi:MULTISPECIES: tetratricopeptide repeat protein [unclassified Novosphingobium]|uniref:tetratricopeptide repeat protein n=1 Tax=unclassified Novosphingobium TaxID=2644732 RepID=UPI0025F7BD6A|nr:MULTISPECIES: tetratricopeptide repeat protein [unclassified Novosphingobium]HQV02884.1 tetratricopeptide repeat protein [Novosphingobium sp.]